MIKVTETVMGRKVSASALGERIAPRDVPRSWFGTPVVICSLIAALQAWQYRYYMTPDGISYLDLASDTARHGLHSLINGYWSPLHPFLLALLMLVLHPSAVAAFPMVHLLNWLGFIASALTFTYFLRSWFELRWRGGEQLSYRTEIAFAYGLFCFGQLELWRMEWVNPDIWVAVFVFLAAGLCCRISIAPNLKLYAALGAVLGMSYYAKAVMLPVGCFLLFFLLLTPNPMRWRGTLIASAALLIVSAPWIAILSASKERLTTGDVGKLAYVWFVNGVQPSVGWTGDQESGTPVHGPRILTQTPRVLEFATPIRGTYPLWYDASYWYEGVIAHFRWSQQLAAWKFNSQYIVLDLVRMSALLAGVSALFALGFGEFRLKLWHREYWIFLWPLSLFILYASVYFEDRYIGPFLILFWLGLYAFVSGRVEQPIQRGILITVIAATLLPVGLRIAAAGAQVATDLVHYGRPSNEQTLVKRLQNLGVHSGDKLAFVGVRFSFYFIRMGDWQAIAQAPQPDKFWAATPEQFQEVRKGLALIGVKALLARDRPETGDNAGWTDIGKTDLGRISVYKID